MHFYPNKKSESTQHVAWSEMHGKQKQYSIRLAPCCRNNLAIIQINDPPHKTSAQTAENKHESRTALDTCQFKWKNTVTARAFDSEPFFRCPNFVVVPHHLQTPLEHQREQHRNFTCYVPSTRFLCNLFFDQQRCVVTSWLSKTLKNSLILPHCSNTEKCCQMTHDATLTTTCTPLIRLLRIAHIPRYLQGQTGLGN